MASNEELACIYSALILADDDVQVTDLKVKPGDVEDLNFDFINLNADKLQTLLKAANVSVEPFWPTLFAKALDGMNIKDLISNIGAGAGAAPAAAAPAADAPAAAAGGGKKDKKEAKKEESEDESDDDMGFGLFD